MGQNKQGDRQNERTTEQGGRSGQTGQQDPSRQNESTRQAKPGTTQPGTAEPGRTGTETGRTEQDRSKGTTTGGADKTERGSGSRS